MENNQSISTASVRRKKLLEIIKSKELETTHEIAKRFDVSVDTIRSDLKLLGFTVKSAGLSLTDPGKRLATKLINENVEISNRELADKSGISLTAVYALRKKLNKPLPTKEELYERKKPEIKKLLDDGVSVTQICKVMQISNVTLAKYREDLGLTPRVHEEPESKPNNSDLWKTAFFGKR